jgi:hypothetical protein
MMVAWFFLHLLGFTLWIGGGLGSMVAGIAGKREDRAGLGALARTQAAIQKNIVAPGALLTILSGLVLTFSVTGRTDVTPGFAMPLMVMQGAGLVGGLITLLVGLPTASKLARLDPLGPAAALFDELRQRQSVVASVGGILAMVALVAGAAHRY